MTVRVNDGLAGCLRELKARGVPVSDLVRGAVTDRLQRLLAAKPSPPPAAATPEHLRSEAEAHGLTVSDVVRLGFASRHGPDEAIREAPATQLADLAERYPELRDRIIELREADLT